MKQEIGKYISGRITLISTVAFISVAFLVAANHILIIPFLLVGTPLGEARWIGIGIDVFFVLIVGAFAIHSMSKMDLERRQIGDLYSTLAGNSPIGIYIAQDRKFVFTNPQFQSYTGYTQDELQGYDPAGLVHPEDRASVRESAVAMLKGNRFAPYEFRAIAKSGRTIWAMETVASISYNGRRAILGSFMDITERRRAEENLIQAAEAWRTTFDSIPDMVSIQDANYRFTRVNMACAAAFKMRPEELIGKTCYEVVHGTKEPWPDCPHTKTLKTKKTASAQFFNPYLGIHLDVTTSPILNEMGEVVTSVHVARDVTERQKMEEQLMIADRLASVGELASGIAHELNNPLTSVVGFSQLLLQGEVPDDIRRDLEVVHSEAQRTAEVVKHLLTFARKHAPVKQSVNLNDIIEKVLALRTYEQRVNNIETHTQLDPDLPQIMADYFQLQQVFLNIIINAEHFMIESNKRGTLTIVTGRVDNTVRAIFSDDGPGIAKEDLGHVFDPFFTTKEVGKGTGLGLSICHGIITEHNGRIYVESDTGKGATFVVELPLATIDREGAEK